MSASEPELDELIGAVIVDKYRVDELVGRGGMGAVYRATNIAIGKRVALKFLFREAASDRDAVTRFQREAEAASAVESSHIVEIFDSGVTADGRPFLVMELLRGEDLRQRLRREGRLTPTDAVRVGLQVARALRRAHQAGIVHRDLKPDNVFLCARDDDPMFVKLVDFGISKIARPESAASALTRRGMVLGTAFYMSPEQAQALPDIDGRTDLFSLGAILYESLAGVPPHSSGAYESVLIDICTKDAPSLRDRAPEVPEALARVIHRALARDRDRRFQSADELSAALASALPGVPIALTEVRSEPLGVVGRPGASAEATGEGAAVRSTVPLPARRERRRAAFVAVGVLTATLLGTVALLAPPSASPPQTGAPGVEAPASSAVAQAAWNPASQRGAEDRAPAAAAASPSPSLAAPDASVAAPTALHSAARPGSTAVTPPRGSSASTRRPRPGVAGGLELATEP